MPSVSRGATNALLAILGIAAVGAGLALAGGGGGELIDVRAQAANARYKKSGTLKRSQRRKLSGVTGITLHQVAVGEPGDPGKVVGVKAYPKMTAHLGVHHNGDVYWIHPFDVRLFAANGLNRETINIEVAGKFGKNSKITAVQAAGVRKAIAFARSQGSKEGAKITKIWAHRQSWDKRGGDPGPAIWKAGALRSGLTRPVFETRGSGKPIPAAWDPKAKLPATAMLADLEDEPEWPDWNELDDEDIEDAFAA